MSESRNTRLVGKAQSLYPVVGCLYISPLSLRAAWYANPREWEPYFERTLMIRDCTYGPSGIRLYAKNIMEPLTILLDSFNEDMCAEALEKDNKQSSPPRNLIASFKDVDTYSPHTSNDFRYLRHLIYALLLDRMRWIFDYTVRDFSPPPVQFQFTDNITGSSEHIRFWDAAGDSWLKTVRDWDIHWDEGWKAAVVRDYDVPVLQALLDAVPPKRTTNVVSNVFLNFLQAAIALRLLMKLKKKDNGENKEGDLAKDFSLQAELQKYEKHRMQTWDDNGLLRVLASAVAFSSIALLCGNLDSGSPRGRGAPSSAWKSLISGIKSPRIYVGGKPRDRARIEYSLWDILLSMAMLGPHVFQSAMDEAVDDWEKLGVYDPKYEACRMPTRKEWDALAVDSDKAKRTKAFYLSRKMQSEVRKRSAKPRRQKSTLEPSRESEEETDTDTDLDTDFWDLNSESESDMDSDTDTVMASRSLNPSSDSELADRDEEFIYPDWDPSTLPRNEEFGRELLAILHPPSGRSSTAPALSSSSILQSNPSAHSKS